MYGQAKIKPKSKLSDLLHLLDFVSRSRYVFMYLLFLVQKKPKVLYLDILKTYSHEHKTENPEIFTKIL